MTTPLGHNRCEHCATLSPLYQPWPLCRDCSETTCAQCTTPGSLIETDGLTPDSVLCLTCTAISNTLCTHCEAATATKFTDPDSPHDPLCQTCYNALWAVCGTCGAEVLKDELGSRETCPASMGGPAEYADACSRCAPEGADEDEDDRAVDRYRDEQEGL